MDANVTTHHDTAPPPFPILTVLATLGLLFFFVSLIGVVYYYSNKMDVATPVISGEQKLAEHVASQKEQVGAYGYDKATNAVKVPVDVAVQKLASIGLGTQSDNKGKLPFPMKPVAKPEAPKAEAIPAPKEAPKETPKTDKK